MPIFIQKNKAILFVHIPKSAGSSISTLFVNNGWEEILTIRGYHLSELSFLRSSFQHLDAASLRLLINLDKLTDVFTVVRHPFDRFVSEYYWQLSQGITQLDPREWTQLVSRELIADKFYCDNHLRPQIDFILPGTRIFKYSQEITQIISEAFGLNLGRAPRDKVGPFRSADILKVFYEVENDIYEMYKYDYMYFGFDRPIKMHLSDAASSV